MEKNAMAVSSLRSVAYRVPLVVLTALSFASAAPAAVLRGEPTDYRQLVQTLQPGDILRLQAGVYRYGLAAHNLNGLAGRRITIEGPARGDSALFLAHRGRNTISIKNASYITIRNLVLDGQKLGADGVKAEGTSRYAHHITIENLKISNHDANQQIVGISTKCPAWSWVVRGNVIDGAGTGMYFGDSDGSAPFIGGVIEGNVVRNTIGYNIEIKQQKPRKELAGMPRQPQVTILRHNAFSKAAGGATGGLARPNVLLGYQPQKGAGRFDRYLVYGNFFYQNPTEALFQATGRAAIYNNAFVNTAGVGRAIMIMPHKGVAPKSIDIFHNTVLASDIGIAVWNANRRFQQVAEANAIFASTPTTGRMQRRANITAPLGKASDYLRAPQAPLGRLDLSPRPEQLRGQRLASTLRDDPAADRDFYNTLRHKRFVGAFVYYGAGVSRPLSLRHRSVR
ncbi:right-handed parallel beta-helix repeat-containing protein [Nitrococcus mobilis]|uniref:right-handed parallel beta-helix repeat-containing protein n=1 Tax=Nitrococcus mobilis TaxID=35797 RepID=UPI0003233F0F|nr:right-handed parallel beta-helix repeat-containing protein [Nitrococcus mobilis]